MMACAQCSLLLGLGIASLFTAAGACSSSSPDGRGAAGTAAICADGDTRECFGPGACKGAQACDNERWSVCDCGDTGGDGGDGEGGKSGGVAGGSTGGTSSVGGSIAMATGGTDALGGAAGDAGIDGIG